MYKPIFNKREVLVFRQFQRKGYSLFACLGREIVISVLSVATLSSASADDFKDKAALTDTTTALKEVWLDDVGINGARAPLTKSQAARMVTVLSHDDIAQAPVQSVNDLLKYAVGIDVRQRGALGSQTDISIRGGTQEQIIILLNGINICDPQTGHNTMDLPVDLREIVRIEVLEGPAGRCYGTSSLVGAVNVVTRATSTSTSKGLIGLEGGSFGYGKIGGIANFPSLQGNHGFANQISGSLARSDGYSRSQAGTLNTDYAGAKAFYQGEYNDERIQLAWHWGISDKGWGSSTFYATPKWQADDQYEHTTKIYSAIQGETKQGPVHFHPTFYWNRNYDRYEGYRGKAYMMKYNYNRCDVYGLNLNSFFDWYGGRTAFGAELRYEDLISSNLGEPLHRTHHIRGTDRDYTSGISRTNISAYLEHNLLFKSLTVSAGLVAVKSSWSAMNMRLYPGVDASFRLNGQMKLHASLNTSLRLPSFTEMYYKLQGYSADPHLKPEEMQAIEIGAEYASDAYQIKACIYHHHGKNMIDWIMDTSLGDNAVWESVNHTRINSVGIEASMKLNLGLLLPSLPFFRTVHVSYSLINQDKDIEENLVSQYAMEYLRHKLVGILHTRISNRIDLNLHYRWQDRVGTYTDFRGSVHQYRPFGLLDARLSWNAPRYSVYAEVNNMLNKKNYVDYGNVPQPGSWIIVGLEYKI